MLRTRLCEMLGISHPIVLGGMGTGTNPELVAAVTNAGGFGILGVNGLAADQQRKDVARLRELTDGPFGLNHLLCFLQEDRYAASLEARPKVISTAWPWPEQDLKTLFGRAHECGALVMHMVSEVPEAERAVEAGADLIVAQGSEGGGHVGWMGSFALLPMVVRAVAPVPVLAAGGVADGSGLAAALAFGAEGILMGTRFLATPEAPMPEGSKRAIVESDGHDTLLTEIPDIVSGRVWPGAMTRCVRNRAIERWVGREWEVRQRRQEIARRMAEARQRDDTEEYHLSMGQSAGLIDAIQPAEEVVRQVAADAERIIRERLEPLVR